MNFGPLTLLLVLVIVLAFFKLFPFQDTQLVQPSKHFDHIKKRVLVAGGAGFVGSNLVRELLKDNSTYVCVIDNLSSGQLDNLKEFFNNSNFKFLRTDVRFSIEQNFDEIFHLASLASPQDFTLKRIETFEANFEGAKTLLNLAHGFKSKILFSSSSEVYGNPIKNPQAENYTGNVNPVGLRSSYDEAKRATESLFEAYRVQKNASTYIVRIFNTYGPGMSLIDGRLVNSVISKALKNETITIYGDGNQTRSLMYIDDLIRGLILTINSDFHQPINLGNPQELTVNQIVDKIIKATNSSSKIIHDEPRVDDPLIRRPDVSLAKSVLNWEPTVSFDEGIHKTVEYFKNLDEFQETPREKLVLF